MQTHARNLLPQRFVIILLEMIIVRATAFELILVPVMRLESCY